MPRAAGADTVFGAIRSATGRTGGDSIALRLPLFCVLLLTCDLRGTAMLAGATTGRGGGNGLATGLFAGRNAGA